MQAYTRLVLITWTPPQLNDSQERALAEAVHQFGLWPFIRQFVALGSGDLLHQRFDSSSFFAFHFSGLLCLAFFILPLFFVDMGGQVKPGSLQDALIPILCIGAIGSFLFYFSLSYCICWYATWLLRIKRRHCSKR